jgi:alanine racemase
MDMTMLDVTDIKGDIKVGDEVFIFDNENQTLEELVELIGTTGYEFLSRLNNKIKKIVK